MQIDAYHLLNDWNDDNETRAVTVANAPNIAEIALERPIGGRSDGAKGLRSPFLAKFGPTIRSNHRSYDRSSDVVVVDFLSAI